MAGRLESVAVENIGTWDDLADVIVIGMGIAGACAALEAARAGADVLVLERSSGGGGTSITSSGIFYLGGGTALQKDCGITDSVDDLYRYLLASCGVADPALLRVFAEGAPEHFDWLEAQGIPFERSYYRDKHFCPDTTEGLLGTGNEKIWPYNILAAPATRGHRVAKAGDAAGSLAMEQLLERCAEAKVRTSYDTRVTALVVDESGKVVGVRANSFGSERSIGCRGGVVIATGGFQHNKDMMERHAPWALGNVEALGVPYNDGAGIELGQAAGGAVQAMDAMMITASFYPPSQLIRGILVNNQGERFVAEDSYHGRTASFVREQPGGIAYLILDSDVFEYPLFHEAFGIELVDGWETIAEMEAGLSLPPGSLQRTMANYNDAAARGEDPALHKHHDWLKPLTAAPYAAFDVSFNRARHNCMTLGGLRISLDGAVLSTQGAPVPGLYAAGACTANIVQDAKGYASGMTLAPGSFFGRRAGKAAALASKMSTAPVPAEPA